MAVSIYDMIEGKWYVELSNGERLPCESASHADELESVSDQELDEYKNYLVKHGLMPQLQTIYDV